MKRLYFAAPIVMTGFLAGVIHLKHSHTVHAQSGSSLSHKQAAFDFEINAPYPKAAPLFGAEGERAWGGADWDPRFLYPSPARDVPGAVFTVQHGSQPTIWITPRFDLAGRHIQHVIFVPGAMVTLLDITFPSSPANVTKVHVSYERTALDSAYNDHVETLSAHDAAQGPRWQRAIDSYFASLGPH
jgi:hypothetical protein